MIKVICPRLDLTVSSSVQVQEGQGQLLPEHRRPSDLQLEPAPRLQHGAQIHGLHRGGVQTAGEIKRMNNCSGASGGDDSMSLTKRSAAD